ncbi:unnamed protein product [Cylindrotheca closterium]|uniref:Phytanoyl-CoA dioxygenase n=1 Tax=Cylindrotheca closterium TaxID=2856 RepID=A0AAD2FNA4_9STRA|nr:unnamed protein product [Cylindrotheca closterium]
MSHALQAFYFVFALGSTAIDAFTPSPCVSATTTRRTSTKRHIQNEFASSTSLLSSASELLYQDQQEAMLRRALHEEELLSQKSMPKELQAATIKAKPPKSGTGFADKGAMDPSTRQAAEQAKIMKRDGVLRINNVLSPDVCDKLRQYMLDQQTLVESETASNPQASKIYYGVEQTRKNRADMHLTLTKGGVKLTDGNSDDESTADDENVLAEALQELLSSDGTLRPIYEALVSKEGEFYELAGIITKPGSYRQMVHPDLPFQDNAPLYVIFLALQDVTEEMGPTSFLLKSHVKKAIEIFDGGDMDAKDDQLRKADCRFATLSKGAAVLFDARVLHCGGANDIDKGATRVMLNFSFRNPKVQGDIGYKGSMMPGYVGAMTLGNVSDALDRYNEGEIDPFASYGDGTI